VLFATIDCMRITALAGGVGGARFLRALRDVLAVAEPAAAITVIGNTGDDIDLFGLRVCPDLDSIMYTLGGGIDEERGWGRADEGWRAKGELAAYGYGPDWFGLGDRDLATHLIRTQLRNAGYPLHEITRALCRRWRPGVTLLPMTDDRVETHVLVDDDDTGARAIHFQEWWVRHRAEIPARGFQQVGAEQARPAPGVLDAIRGADIILLPPSNPVVSIGAILSVPGIRTALMAAAAPVVGVSPIIGGAPVRGMADACLAAIGVPTDATAVALHYGSDLLDGWLVAPQDADPAQALPAHGIAVHSRDLLMSDPQAAGDLALAAYTFARAMRR
jgi:LPPG:FO 2-phospho-L-lactate transferase